MMVHDLFVAPWMSPVPCSITCSEFRTSVEQTIDSGVIKPTKQMTETIR